MPNNTLLMIGIGLAAFTLFRREETDVGEEDLVNASMLASGTGETGKDLAIIPTIAADIPIGGETVEGQPMADQFGWLRDLFSNIAPAAITPKNGSNVKENNSDTELPNVPTGPAPEVKVTPFVQTPVTIQSTGELAGQALRQLGIITNPEEVDLVNPKIFVQEIVMEPEYTSDQPVTKFENVQIVAGGANPGDTYYTNLDVLAAYRDLGGFDLNPPTWEREIGPNVFDPIAAANALAVMTAPIEKKPVLLLEQGSTVETAPVDYASGLDWI
jgi:hypothetical protein